MHHRKWTRSVSQIAENTRQLYVNFLVVFVSGILPDEASPYARADASRALHANGYSGVPVVVVVLGSAAPFAGLDVVESGSCL